ncbi:MAG: UDP-N-acetylglucosamine 2-epimerase (non-hydrolyzing) [Clostridia bacterium]|nr:UDP-N-acetylglucosamine 2-epimerase (non-hydrolyzing) [Clostridia bacterium]
MKKILIAFGTRPEAIKLAPLILELKRTGDFSVFLCHSGQHETLSDEVLRLFGIENDVNLRICDVGSGMSALSSAALLGYERVIRDFSPDCVMVHGDTLTAFFASLAAFYSKTPVFHVEAGLRSYDMYSPFPEEWNRVAIDILATLCFAPTEEARENLIALRGNDKGVFVVGNTVTDALAYTVYKDYKSPLTNKDKRLIIFTSHRRENIGEPLRNICLAVKRIAEEYSDVEILCPMHPNPLVRDIIIPTLSDSEGIMLTEPLSVYDFHNILARAYLVLSDSGGIQEEASTLGIPMLICRDKTERNEGCKSGIIRLTGTGETEIYKNLKILLENEEEYAKMKNSGFSYGDGRVSRKIVKIIKEFFA